ncbi:DUF3105 domain-containing protein [Rhodococcus opacus]|uniref:Hypothetical membrane protein n=1 Tax=Rhodococcus opacus (strain B4) TaxID=632772 RepID=C1ARH1_RHOOB|nr:DUF3105 domain-containing protein [Rhodococcus opacus]BAH48648.1 hypothetical membrane protein [Rhodococcus opacus B4]
MTNDRSESPQSRPKPGGTRRRLPWLLAAAAVAVVGAVAIGAYVLTAGSDDARKAHDFAPSADNPDPSLGIEGIVTVDYPPADHVQAPQRVAYEESPPFGGAHDQYWATCTGIVYPEAIRAENAVHSLEHGAVWVTYDPDHLSADDVTALAAHVDGVPYTLMSPYPGLDSAVSLQSWGHQLRLDDVHDQRIADFLTALRQNPNTYPEPGATCSTVRGGFDPADPPPFDPSAPGPDAVPVDGN